MGLKRGRLILFILSIILFFFVGQPAIRSFSRVGGRLSSYLTYPVLWIQDLIVNPIKKVMNSYWSIRELQHKLEHEQAQNEILRAELIELKAASNYGQHLTELIKFKHRYDISKAQYAQILFKHFSDQHHFFLVNRGSNHGICNDMIAVYKNCLIGRVTDVYPWYSKVIACTDRQCKIAAYCDKTESPGIHVGINKLDCTALDHVSHLCEMEQGDYILSSGEGLIFPRGFALGRIKQLKKEGLWYVIDVEPVVDLCALSYCMLLHKSSTG